MICPSCRRFASVPLSPALVGRETDILLELRPQFGLHHPPPLTFCRRFPSPAALSATLRRHEAVDKCLISLPPPQAVKAILQTTCSPPRPGGQSGRGLTECRHASPVTESATVLSLVRLFPLRVAANEKKPKTRRWRAAVLGGGAIHCRVCEETAPPPSPRYLACCDWGNSTNGARRAQCQRVASGEGGRSKGRAGCDSRAHAASATTSRKERKTCSPATLVTDSTACVSSC